MQSPLPATRPVLAGLLLLFLFSLAGTQASAQDKQKTLYQRLGGYDAIAAVVDDFVPRLVNDPQLAKFFAGQATDSRKKIRQLVVDMVCGVAGGPCMYIGRTMKAAHEGLGITESDWNTSVKHFVATLDKFKVPKKEQDELIAIVSSLKADIVSPNPASGSMK